ncbi:hypothetical protein [Candidatus Magnetomonas plexicatena]|uniref:hypothetical protein n=1 Tax=Candidatus Magnetomonas plexicatena TaxID=2552947 RepID=UPI001C771769|nr:hypothetical protein E2O03_004580 [Nitrospirales bacterium LBB_01]
MKMSHAWRPVILVVGAAVFLLIFRTIYVPSDFTAKNGDYKYQWHSLRDEKYWMDYPVKHMGQEFCGQCHPDKVEKITASGHQKVQCESCHAMTSKPATKHPVDLKEDFKYLLEIGVDSSRELCKRCHAKLPYRPAEYSESSKGTVKFKMIDPKIHNAGIECVTCHDVHTAGFK